MGKTVAVYLSEKQIQHILTQAKKHKLLPGEYVQRVIDEDMRRLDAKNES